MKKIYLVTIFCIVALLQTQALSVGISGGTTIPCGGSTYIYATISTSPNGGCYYSSVSSISWYFNGNYIGSGYSINANAAGSYSVSVVFNTSCSYWNPCCNTYSCGWFNTCCDGCYVYYSSTYNTGASTYMTTTYPIYYYLDADNDNYSTGSSVYSCNNPGANYKTSTLGYDCDDSNPALNRTYPYYADTDGDGYGAGASSAHCTVDGVSPPAGYSINNTDCAPTDAAIFATFSFYADTDADGYGAGSLVNNVCAVNASTPPTGYSVSNTDCAPTDATKHAAFSFYTDADGDGYGTGSLVNNICAVDAGTPPTGYSLNNTDCDDNNVAVYQPYLPTVSIAVYNGNSTVCAGTPVTFVANPTNPGSAPVYKWYLNGGLVQNSSSASFPNSSVSTNDQIHCELTSNSACASTPTANSNTLTMAVINPTAAPATPGTITGTTVVCAASTHSYSIAPVADATQYLWYFPQGTTFVSGQGTTNVTVTYPVNLLNGAVKVEARNCLGISALRVVTLSMLPKPATPGVITGQVKVCPGTYTYSCPVVTNASSYTWTVPANATILSGQGTNSVSIEFAAGYTTGAVKVAASNCKGTSALRTLTVAAYTTLTTPSVITGQSTAVCATTTGLVYSIGAVAGATGYTWTVTGGTIVSGQNTTSLTVDFPASFTTASISVRATNACAQSALRTLSITQKPALPAAISGPASACASTPNIYSTAAVAGATGYNWTLPAGWNLVSGGGTNSITVTAGASGGAVKVAAVNACGTSAFKSTTVTINMGCRIFISSEAVEETQEQVFIASVYPNPIAEKCTVEFTTPAETEPAFVRLFDITGKLITEQQITAPAGINRIEVNMQQQASGVYVIQLQQGDKQKYMRVVKQ